MDTLGLGDRKDDDWMTDGTPPPSRGNLREPQAEVNSYYRLVLKKAILYLKMLEGSERLEKASCGSALSIGVMKL